MAVLLELEAALILRLTFFPKKAVLFARHDPLARRHQAGDCLNNIVSNEDEH